MTETELVATLIQLLQDELIELDQPDEGELTRTRVQLTARGRAAAARPLEERTP